jgi:hypothetical protein
MKMNARIAFTMTTMVFFCLISFWLYGEVRTMCETVGPNTRAIGSGIFLGMVYPALITISALFVVRRFWTSLKPTSLLSIILGTAIGLLTGSILSECWIRADESRFVSEIHENGAGMHYGRARAWPNAGCSLVYIPGKGVHATD